MPRWGYIFSKIHDLFDNLPADKNELYREVYFLIFISFIADAIALLLGRYLRNKIVQNFWDLKYPILRFKNDWYYLLKGVQQAADKDNFPNGVTVEIHLMCLVGKSIILYKGTLADYQLKDEELDYIYMTGVSRTSITDWEPKLKYYINQTAVIDKKNENAKFYIIDSSIMIFKASEIKNIHINYRATKNLDNAEIVD